MALIPYYRVSTDKQGRSGLGLEAQRQVVQDYASRQGLALLQPFVEIETGKRADRPQLTEALNRARLVGATLVIAKLDRLARNVAFVSSLMDSGVDFLALDCPHANRFTLHILAAVAEHESQLISQRTKAALAQARARGVKMGNPNGAAALRRHGRGHVLAGEAVHQQALARAEALRAELTELADLPLARAAQLLNERGILTPRGGLWYRTSVARVLARLGLSRAD